ncbi:unnamed protein product [Haemonchus placei]|uniref:Uncharacterized protein n=1 Tax=Haemonchus placei TaxID=6290 RepID=A0A0N4X451_HAEPC|nr:unnamed protein product [Haemonchus placei]
MSVGHLRPPCTITQVHIHAAHPLIVCAPPCDINRREPSRMTEFGLSAEIPPFPGRSMNVVASGKVRISIGYA